MIRLRIATTAAVLICALALAACGIEKSGGKLAVYDLDRAVASHPDTLKLAEAEARLALLVKQKSELEEEAKARQVSFVRLGRLGAKSKASYIGAYANTKVAELREVETERLAKRIKELEDLAESELGPKIRDVEELFKLEIFNLRARLASLRLKPEARALLEEQLRQVLRERASVLGELFEEKEAFIASETESYADAMDYRLRAARTAFTEEVSRRESNYRQDSKKLLEAFPRPLDVSLVGLEKEILELRRENVALKSGIVASVAQKAEELAKGQGYRGVVAKAPAGEAADDLTDALIQELKK